MKDFNEMNDESLVALVQSGDHEAFATLVERHSRMFYSAAYRVCSDGILAEDIVQDSFLKFWQKPNGYNPSKGAKFTTWFYRVVTNVAIDAMRRKKGGDVSADVLEFTADNAPGADDVMVDAQSSAVLEAAIASLPERQKMALNLCFYEELSNKDAAQVLGVGVKALESLLMRAKAGLRDILLSDTNVERRIGHG